MSPTNQQEEWLRHIQKFRNHESWHTLSKESCCFIERFESNLRYRHGLRAFVVRPFQDAVRCTLAERGVVLDAQPACIAITTCLKRKANISFNLGKGRWIIEIKTNLDFDSLGVAVLEALAFRAKAAATKLVLLSLYGKWRSGNLLDLLPACNLQSAFDGIHILTNNADSGDAWYQNWAANLNRFIASLPEAKVRR